MPRLRSARLAWLVAVVLALVTARSVGTVLADLHARRAALGPPVEVVVAAADLPAGTTLEPEHLRTGLAPAGLVGDDALRRVDGAVGEVTTVPVLAGTVLTARHIGTGPGDAVPPGTRVVRVVAEASVRPTPGAVVDVVGVTTAPDGRLEPEVVAGLTVLGVDDASGTLPDAVSVLLLVDAAEAPRLAVLAGTGPVTLVLAPTEDRCCRRSSSERSRG